MIERKLMSLWILISLVCASIMYISEVFARELIPLNTSAIAQDWLEAPERIKQDTCKILSLGTEIDKDIIYKTMDAFYSEYPEGGTTVIQLIQYIMKYIKPGMYFDENGKLCYIPPPVVERDDSFLFYQMNPEMKDV